MSIDRKANPGYLTLTAVAMIMLLAGCANIKKEIDSHAVEIVSALPIDETLYKPFPPPIPNEVAEAYRNRLAAQMMLDSVGKCRAFEIHLGLGERAVDTFFDTATTVLGTLGATLTHTDTVRALSAAAAISTGTKSAIDADVYANKAAFLIVDAIQNTYDTEFTSITTTKFKLSISEWPLATATGEILLWHAKCSLDGALAHVNKALAEASLIPLDKVKATLQSIDDLKTSVDSLKSQLNKK